MTSPKRWAEVQRIVEAVLERPAVERLEFIASACATDDALREDVVRLTRACEAAGADPGFLSDPAFAFAAPVVAEVAGWDGDKIPSEASLTALRRALADRYLVQGEIARGGMSVVYLAIDRRHDRRVAIKAMKPGLLSLASADRFLLEIQVAARLAHPNILALWDSGEAEGILYYVMPFVAGESLRARLDRERTFPVDEAVRITREVADALGYAHKQEVVHRDIKPENILLQEGHALVADFGIAQARNVADGGVTGETGVVLGTPAYMSPEQCVCSPVIDARSDIYSLGCLLYEMLAGEPPFTGPTVQAILSRHVGERLPSLRLVRPDVPAEIIAVVEKALAKAPADRYATAEALGLALVLKERKRRRVPRPVMALSAVVAVALGVVYLRPLPTRPLDRNKVAIFPLEERGLDGNEQGAGADIMVMVNAALEHADPLRPLDIRDRMPDGQPQDLSVLSAEGRRSIARRVGAAYYVVGVVQAHGDSITVGLRLFDTWGDSLLDQRSATGHRRNTPLHHLGIDAVKALLPSLVDPGRAIDLTPLRDRKASAVALFIQGDREYRRSHFPSALDLYQRALEEDSAFTMAAIKGAMAAYWHDHHLSAQLAALADQRARAELASDPDDRPAHLPARYASLAHGLRMFTLGFADSAEHWLRQTLRDAPDWPEALMALGEVYYHLIPLRSDLTVRAAAQFREAVRADSGFHPPLFHLAEMAVRDGRLRDARELLARFRTTEPRGEHLQRLTAMLGCVEAGDRSFDWTPVARTSLPATLGAAKSLAAGGYQLPCAEGAFRSVLAVGIDSARFQWASVLGLQSVLAAQQRSAEVVALVDSVVAAGPLSALMTTYITDVMADLPVEPQAERVARFARERWGETYEGLARSPQLAWLQWLFGIWHARRGDHQIAESLRQKLVMRDSLKAPRSTSRYLADALGSHLVLLSGDTSAAIAAFRRLVPTMPNDSLSWSQELPLAVERITLARLHLERGQHASAIEVASGFDHPEPMIYVAFLPASLSIRLRAAERLGRTVDAERYGNRLRALQTGKSMQSVISPSTSRGKP